MMDNLERDLGINNINSIDMSINSDLLDDDDMSFGNISTIDNASDFSESDDRNFQPKTGIIIDLSDDDDIKPAKTIKASIDPKSSGIKVDANFDSNFIDETQAYNLIDMETEYFDEDDDDLMLAEKIKLEEKSENDVITEARNDNQGQVEKDYWKNITKKHAKSNTKKAYNTHFHLSGNPKADMEFFNNAMGINSDNISSENDTGAENSVISNITGIASASSETSSASTSGEASGFRESLNHSNINYTEILRDLVKILNIDILINEDNSFTLFDLCDDEVEYRCNDLDELQIALQPYMEDVFIYPLQAITGKKLKTCKEWCDWYSDETNRIAYPKCVEDIKYCDVVANHLKECAIEDLI